MYLLGLSESYVWPCNVILSATFVSSNSANAILQPSKYKASRGLLVVDMYVSVEGGKNPTYLKDEQNPIVSSRLLSLTNE